MVEQGGSDDEALLPPLFEDELGLGGLAPAPRTLANANGWKVVEEIQPDGSAMRWMVSEESLSLDQTRVKLGLPDSAGQRQIDRSHLRATSNQIMAMVVALAPPSAGTAMLGGGGMALPMAILAAGHEGPVHVVELHEVVIDFAQRFFGAEHPQLIIHQGDALRMVADGELAGKLDCKLSTFLVDVDFMRFPEVPEIFLSARFWTETWSMLESTGLVAVNLLGCDRGERLASLISVASASSVEPVDALLLEPHDAELRTWTPLTPRPGVAILGSRERLQPISKAAQHDVAQRHLGHLAREVLQNLQMQRGSTRPTALSCQWLTQKARETVRER